MDVPVCSLFREKIVGGQVCYEADINQFKKEVNWEETLRTGVNLIIDTNDEYDVKRIFEEIPNANTDKTEFLDIYKGTEERNSIVIMLQTISKIMMYKSSGSLLTVYFRPDPGRVGGRGSLQSDRYQGDPRHP